MSKGRQLAEMELTNPFEPDPVNAGVGMDFSLQPNINRFCIV